jgi:putative spermidine/putrescine transport system ATP-binding protein
LVDLSKRYGEVEAVAGIDLEIEHGEFFTMLGPSGSGKTTTLRMIAGFEDPSGGRIELGGRDMAGVPPYARAVNTVFQDYALFPHMTVAENVAYGLRVADRTPIWQWQRRKQSRSERNRLCGEALEMVRLPGYEKRRPAELSGGQRQRVALARAIVNRPQVLLLDEPLGALDLKLREQMQIELKSIQGDVGITFVYVTHDQDEALTMSNRIAVFNDGRIEQVSSPVELYEHPGTEFVAGFVGVSNMLERDGARFTIRPEKIQLLDPATPSNGLRTERGRIADVAYAGMVTRYTVALDAGGELQLVRQNVEGRSLDAASERGKEVLVGWRPEHTVAVRGKSITEEEETA